MARPTALMPVDQAVTGLGVVGQSLPGELFAADR